MHGENRRDAQRGSCLRKKVIASGAGRAWPGNGDGRDHRW